MRSHSDLPLIGSPLPSHHAIQTWTHTPQYPDFHTKKITLQSESHWRANYALTIDSLPDDVLLEIFDCFRVADLESRNRPVWKFWKWHILVHVCHRWRQIIFASPLRLDLQILCTYGTPVRKNLGCWPAFPIVVKYDNPRSFPQDSIFEDDVIAALEHPSRVRQIKLTVTDSFWRKLAPLMQNQFPALRLFSICTVGANVPLLPIGFLGGSALSLREINFHGMPTLALPTLLCSASNLVDLVLYDCDFPPTGYISPGALVTGLAMLPRLNSLSIGFVPCDYGLIQVPPKTRVVLPALTTFSFQGEPGFLEDLVCQIDAPMLNSVEITFLDFPGSPVPHFAAFLNRSDLKPSLFRDARIWFDDGDTLCVFLGPRADSDEYPIAIHITSCEGLFDQVASLAQVLRQISPMLSNVVRLELKAEQLWRLDDEDEDLDRIDWVELLRPFTGVETLRVSEEFAEMVAHDLEEMSTEIASQVLPAVHLLLLEGEHSKCMEKLFSTLRDRDCPLPRHPLSIMRYEGSDPESDIRWSSAVRLTPY